MPNENAMISAPQPEAAEAGAEVLKAGGNAVDAALACAFVQTVVDPHMCGIAGFGSLGIYLPERDHHGYIDFHAPAPAATRPDMWQHLIEAEARDGFGFFLKGRVNEVGHQSIALPATLRALERAHQRFGSMPWRDIIAPALAWSKAGWRVRDHVHQFWTEPSIEGRISGPERLATTPASAALYLDGAAPKPVGTLIRNDDYSDVLAAIMDEGADVFYKGWIADRIVADMRANGGLITHDDLATYQPRDRAPVWGKYRGYDLSTNHAPGGGPLLAQMLGVLQHFDLAALGHNSPEYIQLVAEVMKRATRDKEMYLGDPDFAELPMARFAGAEQAQAYAHEIRDGVRCHVERMAGGIPTKNTTHISVVDGKGGCVSMTHSLGAPSGVVTQGLGFTYNGCMGIFDPRPGRPWSLAPGKARFSSMCPSVLFRDSRPVLVIGAPGATQIAMGVLQVTLNALDFGMTMTEAVSAPRFSATGNIIDLSNRVLHSTQRALAENGYDTVRNPQTFNGFAGVHAVRIHDDGRLDGGADPWLDGLAIAVHAPVAKG